MGLVSISINVALNTYIINEFQISNLSFLAIGANHHIFEFDIAMANILSVHETDLSEHT